MKTLLSATGLARSLQIVHVRIIKSDLKLLDLLLSLFTRKLLINKTILVGFTNCFAWASNLNTLHTTIRLEILLLFSGCTRTH